MHMRGNVKLSIKTVYVKYAKTYQTKVQIAHFISQYSTVVFVNRDGQDHNTRLALRKYRTSHEVWSLPNADDIHKLCCAYLHSPKLTAIAELETYLN